MWGAKESLNVSVAFGIAIYQLKTFTRAVFWKGEKFVIIKDNEEIGYPYLLLTSNY